MISVLWSAVWWAGCGRSVYLSSSSASSTFTCVCTTVMTSRISCCAMWWLFSPQFVVNRWHTVSNLFHHQLHLLQLHMTSLLHCVMQLMCSAGVFRAFQCVLQRCACQCMMCAVSVLSRTPSPFSWTADCDYRCGSKIVGPAVSKKKKKMNREEAADVVSEWFVVPAQYPIRIPQLQPRRF